MSGSKPEAKKNDRKAAVAAEVPTERGIDNATSETVEVPAFDVSGADAVNAPANADTPPPTADGYVEPARKWAEFGQHWNQWSGQFAQQFDLPADDVRATKGDRAAIALLVQNRHDLLDAIAYQQVDAFISTLTI